MEFIIPEINFKFVGNLKFQIHVTLSKKLTESIYFIL